MRPLFQGNIKELVKVRHLMRGGEGRVKVSVAWRALLAMSDMQISSVSISRNPVQMSEQLSSMSMVAV